MAYCRRCGTELVEGAAFCPQCGTGVAAAPVPAGDSAAEPSPKRAKSRKKLVVGVVAALVVVCAAAGGGWWWKTDQDAKARAAAQAEWERTHVSLVSPVPVQAPGFDDAATAIPVKVSGTDLDGTAVDEVQYLRPNSMQVSTLPGSYDLTFVAGYFTGTGGVVKAPDTVQHIEVVLDDGETDGEADGASPDAAPAVSQQSESTASDAAPAVSQQSGDAAQGTSQDAGQDAAQGASQAAAQGTGQDAAQGASQAAAQGTGQDAAQGEVQPAVFTEVAPLEVTDELIAVIAEWAGRDPQDDGKAQALGQSASTAHQEAVAAEEARIAAEAEAARKQAELQAAYDANPRTVYAAPSQSSAPVNLTGTIDVQLSEDTSTHEVEEVVMLVLPSEVTVTGTQYGEISNSRIAILGTPESLAQYKALAGRTVTLNLCLNVRVTANLATARFTYLRASSTTLVKTFD